MFRAECRSRESRFCALVLYSIWFRGNLLGSIFASAITKLGVALHRSVSTISVHECSVFLRVVADALQCNTMQCNNATLLYLLGIIANYYEFRIIIIAFRFIQYMQAKFNSLSRARNFTVLEFQVVHEWSDQRSNALEFSPIVFPLRPIIHNRSLRTAAVSNHNNFYSHIECIILSGISIPAANDALPNKLFFVLPIENSIRRSTAGCNTMRHS